MKTYLATSFSGELMPRLATQKNESKTSKIFIL